jgi:hypothetical protein
MARSGFHSVEIRKLDPSGSDVTRARNSLILKKSSLFPEIFSLLICIGNFAKSRCSKEEIYSQLLVIEAVDFQALEAVSKLLKATLFTQENGRLPYDQSYQFITELQGRSLI